MEDFFYTCNHFPYLDEKYIDEALSLSYVERVAPALLVGGISTTFANTDFYKNLNKAVPCSSPIYLKWPANTCYNWHTDGFNRRASINIPLVSTFKCVTMFKTKNEGSIFDDLFQVEYVMYKPTVLNTQQEHGVFNFSDQDRYVINIGFNTVTYKSVVEYLKNLKIDNY